MDLTELLLICSRMRRSSDLGTHSPCSPPVEQLLLHSSGGWAVHHRVFSEGHCSCRNKQLQVQTAAGKISVPRPRDAFALICPISPIPALWKCFHQAVSSAESPQSKGCPRGGREQGQPSLSLCHCTQGQGQGQLPTCHWLWEGHPKCLPADFESRGKGKVRGWGLGAIKRMQGLFTL